MRMNLLLRKEMMRERKGKNNVLFEIEGEGADA
jgi:hypothetical protein